MTSYIVLVQMTESPTAPSELGGVTFGIMAQGVEASSAAGAIRKVLESGERKNGTYVAVPLRSFQPVAVKLQTQTRLVLS